MTASLLTSARHTGAGWLQPPSPLLHDSVLRATERARGKERQSLWTPGHHARSQVPGTCSLSSWRQEAQR